MQDLQETINRNAERIDRLESLVMEAAAELDKAGQHNKAWQIRQKLSAIKSTQ